MWDLPGPGLEPMSPALAGGFLTIAPPGKPQQAFLNTQYVLDIDDTHSALCHWAVPIRISCCQFMEEQNSFTIVKWFWMNCILVRDLQRNRNNRRWYRYRHSYSSRYRNEIYYKDLAHEIMEAEKSQDLQLASWRPGKADDKVPAQVQRPGKQMVCFSLIPSLRQEKFFWCPSSKIVRQGERIPSCSAFYSVQAFSGLGEGHSRWDRLLTKALYLVYKFKC